jgi:tetratricopeptide (TPR) repeat protein
VLAVLACGTLAPPAPAQPVGPVTDAERRDVVERLGETLEARYVFPEVAERCARHVAEQLDAGAFDGLSDPEAFAQGLTEALQSISRDRHMRVRLRPAERLTMERENPARARVRSLDRARSRNYGFERVERLEGNVGYLDMRSFAGTPLARDTAAAAMAFLANADALVFDMRRNGGGSPEMIRFICSYLFDEPTHLNSLYWREGDRTDEFWTLDEIPGRRMPDVPCFVLTSDYTFSGAEEFTYNLKTRRRATIIGETTGGGANPGGMFPVGGRFAAFVPTGRAINPVTGTNWEGTGVAPDVDVPAEDALDVALERARAAAERFRAARAERLEQGWAAFDAERRRAVELEGQGRHVDAAAAIVAAVRTAHGGGLIGEMDINMAGYEQLGAGRTELAIAVFRLNTELYPDSSNVWDSLGEAYMNAGDSARAIRHYRRSLELDPSNGNAEAMIRRMQEDRGSP